MGMKPLNGSLSTVSLTMDLSAVPALAEKRDPREAQLQLIPFTFSLLPQMEKMALQGQSKPVSNEVVREEPAPRGWLGCDG